MARGEEFFCVVYGLNCVHCVRVVQVAVNVFWKGEIRAAQSAS